MKKTWISEAALAALASSGFQIIQEFNRAGIDEVTPSAFGAFIAGLFILVRRHVQKKQECDALKGK